MFDKGKTPTLDVGDQICNGSDGLLSYEKEGP